jgi:hypothetical protein
MIKEIEIQVRELELKVQIEIGLVDQGIGAWECHGRGYHTDIVVEWDEVVYTIEMESYKSSRVYSFDYDKLNERNQAAIYDAICAAVNDMTALDIRAEMMERAI